jgi:hypothetical protein
MEKWKILLIAIGIVLGIQSCKKVPENFAASDKYRLVWNDDPTSTLTIAWDQNDSVKSPVVLYSETDHGRKYWKYEHDQQASLIRSNYDMNTHFAGLSGLKANTPYYFVIKDERGVSERYWFKTAPDSPQPFTFITGGDSKSSGGPLEAGRNSNRIVSKLRPLFVAYNGDFTSGDGTDPERWKLWLHDWQELTTTDDGRMIPIVPVHGNHEDGDMANLPYIFNTPYQNNDSTNVYYSLSFGGHFFHLTVLNSQIDEGGEQKEWLKKDLEQHRDYTFKVVGYHKPFFPHTSGKAENQYQYDQWAYLFYQYGVNLSVDGDSHMHKITYPLRPDSTENSFMGFVRDDQTGTLFVGEGSWGARPRINDDDKPWTLTSGSLNQVKWIHVLPQEKEEEAHLKIFTVPAANYDESDSLISFNQEIEALTEENLLEIPLNMKFFETGSARDYVRYPLLGDE